MRRTFVLGALLVLTAPSAGAQGRSDRVPPGHRPPPGSCRVWVDGVPPGRQSAPTDCATAERTRPANAVVIYGDQAEYRGDEYRGKGKKGKGRGNGRYADQGARRDDRYDRDDDRYDDRNDRAGRYPDTTYRARFPRTLPEMIAARSTRGGLRTTEQRRWLGRDDALARATDVNRDGRPDRIVWRDRTGGTVQAWHDDDRDGHADRVVIYRGGRVERVIRR